MYLTYDEYVNRGGTLTETDFSNLEMDAETVIDWYTFNRLDNFTTIPEEVKRCTFKLIRILSVQDNVLNSSVSEDTDSKSIVSQSNDGVSISYNVLSASELLSQAKREKNSTVLCYLSRLVDSKGRKILYRGVYPDE